MKVGEFHIVETMSFTLIFAYKSHVWGHFCLCYRDQRLVNDKTSIRYLGLNDGDQLHFVRHLSIDHSPMNKRSKSPSCKRYLQYVLDNPPIWSLHFRCTAKEASYGRLEVESNATQIQIQNQNQNTVDNVASDKCYPGAEDELPAAEFRLVKGWLPYARHWGVARKGPDSRIGPSKFSLNHFGGRPKM